MKVDYSKLEIAIAKASMSRNDVENAGIAHL